MNIITRQIESTEYVDDLFELKSRYGVPMLRQFAELVNREMFWVVTEVCSEHNLVRRSKIIKQFIKIARECPARWSFENDSLRTSILMHLFENRTVQGMQKFQFYVRYRVWFGARSRVAIARLLGETAKQISEAIQRFAGTNGSKPQHEQV